LPLQLGEVGSDPESPMLLAMLPPFGSRAMARAMRVGEDAMLAVKLCREKWAELPERTEVRSISFSSSASVGSSAPFKKPQQPPLSMQHVMVRTRRERKMTASAM
jgi:hypothetical protein